LTSTFAFSIPGTTANQDFQHFFKHGALKRVVMGEDENAGPDLVCGPGTTGQPCIFLNSVMGRFDRMSIVESSGGTKNATVLQVVSSTTIRFAPVLTRPARHRAGEETYAARWCPSAQVANVALLNTRTASVSPWEKA
jgi:hypothetical protein